MAVATKPADNENLQQLVPLNVLSEERFAAVARKIVIEEVRKGRYLFRQGERDNQSVYLLDGRINLIDADGKVTDEVEAGTDISRYPIANQQPRPLSARAVTKTVIARIDSGLLEVFLAWDQASGAEVTEITADDDEDWMTRILQSEVFENFPPAVIQRLLMKMQPYPVRAGQEIITEGAEGDYFYTIHKGECAVTRRESAGGSIIKLAELHPGDSFGEDALVTDSQRNATVTMLTDGVLMRLGKGDFAELLQKQLVKYVDFKTAGEMVDAGAVWIDVRSAAEYESGAFEDSVNIPLSELRGELGELVFNAKYVTCCDTSLRSTSAAFLLSHRGFEVYVLKGGLKTLSTADNPLHQDDAPAGSVAAEPGEAVAGEQTTARVIDFNRNQETAADAEPGAEIAFPHRENSELRDAIASKHAVQATGGDRQDEVEGLEAEAREARSRLVTLQEQLQAAAGEAQRLREEQAELQREKQERVTRLEQELGNSGARIEQLQAELESGRQEVARLQALLESGQHDQESVVKRLERDLEQALHNKGVLESERDAARKELAAARAGAETTLQEHQQRLEKLHDELDRSRQQIAELEDARDRQLAAGAHADSEREAYAERLEQQRSALEESRQRVTELEATLSRAAEESRALQEQAQAEQGEQAEVLAQRQAELEESRQRVAELEAALSREAEESRALQEQAQAEQGEQAEALAQHQAELEESRQRVAELEAALSRAAEESRALQEQAQAEQGEQAEALAQRQAELEESRQRVAELEAALSRAAEESRALQEQAQAEQAAHAEKLEGLRERLSESRLEIDRLTAAAQEAQQKAAELQQQLDEQLACQRAEQARYEERQAVLQKELEATALSRQDLQQQLVALQEVHDSAVERLTASESARAEIRARADELEQQLRVALDEKQRLELQAAALETDVENLKADKQAAGEALAQLQGEWETERNALREEIATANRRTDEHDARLVEYQEAVQRERMQIEAAHESRMALLNGQIEQQEARVAQLQQDQAAQAEHYQAIVSERDAILVKLNESDRLCATQKQEITTLNKRVGVLSGTADEKVVALSEQLEKGQHEIAEAGRQAAEQAARIEALQAELAQREEADRELLARVETLQQENETLRSEVLETEERARNSSHDTQEAINKAYEDLTHKNEVERELQGQIERLRKKLEQSSRDLQASRVEVRESAERFRDELNAERRAREEERVQLAARQKELKEQLAAVAKEHEEVLAAQNGLLARARSAGRDEERSRLQQAQNERLQRAEAEVARLQAELDKTQKELAAAARQEQEGSAGDQADTHAQQAETTAVVARLESRLEELARERDAALEDHRSIKEQLKALRAEVEVARGLMGADADGRVEDTANLRAELADARKNVDIAVRLRSEAEAQRDKALQAVQSLRRGEGEIAAPDTPLEIPSLDDVHPILEARINRPRKVRHWVKAPLPAKLATPPTGQDRLLAAPAQTPKVGKSRVARPGWLPLIKGITALAVVAIAAFLSWQTLQGENPLSFVTIPLLDAMEPSTPGSAGRKPLLAQSGADSIASSAGVPPGMQETAGADSAVQSTPATRPAAVRTFRDRLKGGGLGPRMVELPAAVFLMGSGGSSLNFDERPQHRVELAGFGIGAHEVSFAEYDRFARATGRRLPHDEGWGRGDQPVINVSWKDAKAYAGWLSKQTGHTYRLPTEAQWEFAARGATQDAYWWDSDMDAYPANCFDCGNPWDGQRTTAVGRFAANSFGLHDTAGNVQEWVEDCYAGNYEGAPTDGSARQMPHCTQRVVRGGAYTSPVDSLRSTNRARYDQDTRLDNLGFRVVRVN